MENQLEKIIGYKDVPIESIENDRLDVRQYVDSLSDFIRECDTPMTIAIQGDWGSGKTSIMNMIKNNIEKEVVPIWFNTWQYSQFEMQPYLAISLLGNFLEKLDSKDGAKKFFNKFGNFLKNTLKGATIIATEKIVGETIAGNVNDKLSSNPVDIANEISELKSNIENVVKVRLEKSDFNRIVVFIDDLDRLAPEKAVELLEVLKVFMDVDNCVFILAVDYSVVIKGLERKYGEKVGHNKGKSFFDKIIQLPFNVPIGQYKVDNYIKTFLEKMRIKSDNDEIAIYSDLIDYSIGFNPRSVKRIFNSFLLLNKVAEKKDLFVTEKEIDKKDIQRVLFAVLCMQMAFDSTYAYFLKNIDEIDDDLFNELRSLTDIKTISETDDYFEIKNDISNPNELNRFSNFMDIFYRSLQIGKEKINELDEFEITNLKMILTHSSITSAVQNLSASQNAEKWKKTYFKDWNDYSESLKDKNFNFTIIELYKEIHDEIAKIFTDIYKNYTPTHLSFRIISDKKKDNWFLSTKPQKSKILLTFKSNELDFSELPKEIIHKMNYRNKFHQIGISSIEQYQRFHSVIIKKITDSYNIIKKQN